MSWGVQGFPGVSWGIKTDRLILIGDELFYA